MLRLQSTSDNLIGLASKADFEKILEVWNEACKKIDLVLSKQVVNEFNKRINNATVKNAKAKLDLSNSYLDHQKTILLIEALAIKPVIAKLNLSDNNINNETIRLLIRLLKGQSSLVRKIALDDRLNVVFLGDVILKNQSNFDIQLLLEIKSLTAILSIANVQAYIRIAFLEYFKQGIIDVTILTKVWTSVVGSKLDKNKLVQIFSSLNFKDKNMKNIFNYQELESIMIQGLIQRGSLSNLTEKQRSLLSETSPTITNTSPLNFNSFYGSTSPPAYMNYINSTSPPPHAVLQSSSTNANNTNNNVGIMNETISNDNQYSNNSPRRSSIKEVQEIVAINTIKKKYYEDNLVQVIIPDTDLLSPITSPQSVKTFPTPYGSNNSSNINTDNDNSIKSLSNNIVTSTEITFSPSIKNESVKQRQLSPSPSSQRKSIEFNLLEKRIKSNQESSPIKVELNDMKQFTSEKLVTTSPSSASSVKSSQKPILHEQNISTNNTTTVNINSQSTSKKLATTVVTTSPSSVKSSQKPILHEQIIANNNTTKTNATQKVIQNYDNIIEQFSITSSEEYKSYVQKFDDLNISHDVEEVIPSDSTFIQYDISTLNHKDSMKHMNDVFKYCNVEKKSNIDFASILDMDTTPALKVLILRNDNISTIDNLALNGRFPHLTDLDLGYNNMTGTIKSCPQTLLRLDLSYNKLSNISAILLCISLQELNLSNNLIKNFHGLPNRLRRLDISHNLIKTISTIRTLALSPSISSIAIHHNDITMQGNEWKVTLRSILLNLIEIDGKVLPNKKNLTNNGVVNKINNKMTNSYNNNKPVETMKKTSIASKDQQQINDTIRTRQHQLNLLAKEHSKLKNNNINKDLISKRTSLRPNEVSELTKRLTSKSISNQHHQQQQQLVSNQIFKEMKRDSISRILSEAIPKTSSSSVSYKQQATKLHPSQSFSKTDVDLSSWVSNSKQELCKAVNMIKKSFELAKQKDITSKDLMKYSHSLSLISFYSSQDLPLKVEYAIEKLSFNDPLYSKIRKVREHIDKISTFLHQIESAILLSMKGAFQLIDSLDILMTSNAGLYKNVKLFKQYGYTYDPSNMNKNTISDDNDNISDIVEPELYSENKSYFDSYNNQYHQSEENNEINIEKELIKDPKYDSLSVEDEYSYRVISPTTSPEQTLKSNNKDNKEKIIDSNDDILSLENTNLLLDRMRNRITMRTIQNSSTPDVSKISFFQNLNSNIKVESFSQEDLNDNLELMLSKSIKSPESISSSRNNNSIQSNTLESSIISKEEKETEEDINNIETISKDQNEIKNINQIETKLTAKERLQLRMQKSNSEVILSSNNNTTTNNTTTTAMNEVPKIYEKSKSLQITASPIKILNDNYYEVIFETNSLGFTLMKAYNDMPKVSKVNQDGPAYHAGIECNDSITRVGDILIKDYDEATNLILQSPRPLKIRFNRGLFSPNKELKHSLVKNKNDHSFDIIENNNNKSTSTTIVSSGISNKISDLQEDSIPDLIQQLPIVTNSSDEFLSNCPHSNTKSIPESYLQGIKEIESPNNTDINKLLNSSNISNIDINDEKGYDLLSSLVESSNNITIEDNSNNNIADNDKINTDIINNKDSNATITKDNDNISYDTIYNNDDNNNIETSTSTMLIQDHALNDIKTTAKDRLLARMAKNKK